MSFFGIFFNVTFNLGSIFLIATCVGAHESHKCLADLLL